jgi:hypothetical protein
MLERLMERGKTSGRDDDNVESIKKRFRKLLLPSLLGWTEEDRNLCRDFNACCRLLPTARQGRRGR